MVLSEVMLSWDINGVPTGRGPLKGLTAAGLRYIRNPDGQEELYDYVQDPAESRNLVHLEEHRAAVERFRAALPAYAQNSVPSWSRYESST